MQSPELLWFDREFDAFGRPIRGDVREAAKSKWPQLAAVARRRLGDHDQEIQEAFERSVEMISRFLDRKNAPPQDPSALLAIKFRQELHASWRRLSREASMGTGIDLEPMLAAKEWEEEADQQLLLDEIVRRLSNDNRTVLRLRGLGYEWSEIARMLQRKSSTVRNKFWQEVRRVQSELREILEEK